MDAVAERERLRVGAIEAELVGVGPAADVAVDESPEDGNLLTGRESSMSPTRIGAVVDRGVACTEVSKRISSSTALSISSGWSRSRVR